VWHDPPSEANSSGASRVRRPRHRALPAHLARQDGLGVARQPHTYYDALYVALAARLGFPLLTADARLAHAPGLPCAVELVD